MSLHWESFQWECLGEQRGRAEGEDGLTVSNTYKVNGVRPTSENGILVQSTLFRCKACDQRFAIRGDITELRAHVSRVSMAHTSHAKSHDPLAAAGAAGSGGAISIQPVTQSVNNRSAPVIGQPLIPSAGPHIAGPPVPNHQPTGSSNPSGDEDATLNGTDSSPPLPLTQPLAQPADHAVSNPPDAFATQPPLPNRGSPASGPEHQLTGASSSPDTIDSVDVGDVLQLLSAEEIQQTGEAQTMARFAAAATLSDSQAVPLNPVDPHSIDQAERLPPNHQSEDDSSSPGDEGLSDVWLANVDTSSEYERMKWVSELTFQVWDMRRQRRGKLSKSGRKKVGKLHELLARMAIDGDPGGHPTFSRLGVTLGVYLTSQPSSDFTLGRVGTRSVVLRTIDHDHTDDSVQTGSIAPALGDTLIKFTLDVQGLGLSMGSECELVVAEAAPRSSMLVGTTGVRDEPDDIGYLIIRLAPAEDTRGVHSPFAGTSDAGFADDCFKYDAYDDAAEGSDAAEGGDGGYGADESTPADSPCAYTTSAALHVDTAAVRSKTRSRLDDACTSAATIGNGVEVEASNIKEAGRGLFARGRSFAKGDLVTEYSGARLKDKMEAVQRVVQTHILHCSAAFHGQLGNDIYIDGDRVPQPGRGGASFANHKPKRRCNAEFVYRQIDGEGKVFLQATDDIHDGDEIYAHCGSDLEVMMGEKRREVDGQSTRTVHVPWGALHMHGFEVFKDALRLDEATKVAIKASPSEDIFNGKDGKGRLTSDGRRRQTTGAPEWTTTVTPRLDTFLRTCDVMRCSQGEKTLNKLVALSSRPRASKQKKHQPRHADSAARNSLRDAPSEDVPLACIVALQDGTRLHVWPFDTGVEKIITLEEGDAILFRGDLGHAGSEYDKENWRLHIYIDSPVIERAKEEDGTPSTFPF